MKPIYYLLILLVLSSCSSVQKTMNKIKANPELSKAVVKYVISDLKLCVNDTVIVSKDSIIYLTKDSLIRDTITAGKCPDFVQVLPSGIKVSSKNGVLDVQVPVKNTEKVVTRTVTNNIRDKKLEDIRQNIQQNLKMLVKDGKIKRGNLALKIKQFYIVYL